MKILVIGLSGAIPELLFGGERLENIHRLLEFGAYGGLQNIQTSDLASSWLSMAASQEIDIADPDKTFNQMKNFGREDAAMIGVEGEPAYIWEQVLSEGREFILVGDPRPAYQKNATGVTIGSHISSATDTTVSSNPPSVMDEIAGLVGDYPVDVIIDPAGDQKELIDQIYAMSQKQFQVVRHLIATREWGYFQFIEIGVQRIQQLFTSQPNAGPDAVALESKASAVISDYYFHLDQEIGKVLELLTDDTILLLVSPGGGSGQDGIFTLMSANNPLNGEIQGVRLIDIAPTLLELGAYQIPKSMQGKSLVRGLAANPSDTTELSQDEEAILRERLSGLGYL